MSSNKASPARKSLNDVKVKYSPVKKQQVQTFSVGKYSSHHELRAYPLKLHQREAIYLWKATHHLVMHRHPW